MNNFLLIVFAIFLIYYPTNISAMIVMDQDGLEKSRKSFLISGVPYDENKKENGVMTLCFKTANGGLGITYKRAALVFEMFLPESPEEVSVHMTHYIGEMGFLRETNRQPKIETTSATLELIRGAMKIDLVTDEKTYLPPTYTRYASWVLPNSTLIDSFKKVKTDYEEHQGNPMLCDSYNSISYVQRIMDTAGFAVNFGFWIKRSRNLKILIDNYVIPKPDRKNSDYQESVG